MTYIVDTHPLVWFLEGNARLSKAARGALSDPNARLVVPTIVLAETTFLYARKRVAVDLHVVSAHLVRAPNCIVYPLDLAVVERLPTTLNIHDVVIVATALVFRDILGEETTIISKDADISSSNLVPVVW